MKSSREKKFISWLKHNAFKRDVTGLIKQRHRSKTLDEIIELEFGDDDLPEEKEAWKDNYSQVTAWYELEYFFERSYDDLCESWFVGEIFTNVDSDDSDGWVWGIKGELHFELKLREWVERLGNGEVTLVDVWDEIPGEFGGDLESDGRFRYENGAWVKFKYDSERNIIKDPTNTRYASVEDTFTNTPTPIGNYNYDFSAKEKKHSSKIESYFFKVVDTVKGVFEIIGFGILSVICLIVGVAVFLGGAAIVFWLLVKILDSL